MSRSSDPLIGGAAISRILVVDDDVRIRSALTRALSGSGTEVRAAENAEAALAVLARFAPHVVLTDVRMPGMDGVALLELLRRRVPAVDVLVMSAYEDLPTVASAMRAGAADFLVKPLDLHQLRRLLDRLEEDRLQRESQPHLGEAPPPDSPALIGRSPAMIEIFKQVGRAARGRATVLIRGETGTGKELIARAVHETSPFAEEPFVALNCAAIPTPLLESELFGHVRGAFTGAASDRLGKFAASGRGTLLLDEIGDTTNELQAKLLRVLQEREFQPVGADRTERAEARVIAVTHRDLETMVRRGEFREDLYYRLRVVEIRVPPLRERLEDLPLLTEHLLNRAAAASGGAPPSLGEEVVAKLEAHSWPGNVRELEHCLLRAVLACPGDRLRPEHIAFDHGTPRVAGDAPVTLDDAERVHVIRVLRETGGNKSRAARTLGISRPRLDRLLRKHDIRLDELTDEG